MEKENLIVKLSEKEKLIAALREQVIDTVNTSARLSKQLKRAVASKCDLVVICSEIESQKLSMQETFEKEYRKAHLKPLKEREMRAQVEREFMNEIEHVLGEINDMHRRHRNTMLEKDLEIAQLQKRIHQEQSKRSN
jgi:phenylpropionate dioxygenase-like ring-hydroxylating dioxygenase large terminal subunit